GIRDFHVTGVQTCALPILLVQPASSATQAEAAISALMFIRFSLVHKSSSPQRPEMGCITVGVGPHESVFYPVAAIMVDSSANKRILADLVTNAGIRAMRGHHHNILVQGVQPLPDRTLDLRIITAPQVGTAYAPAEQGVAGNEQPGFGEPEAHRTGGM